MNGAARLHELHGGRRREPAARPLRARLGAGDHQLLSTDEGPVGGQGRPPAARPSEGRPPVWFGGRRVETELLVDDTRPGHALPFGQRCVYFRRHMMVAFAVSVWRDAERV